MSKIFGRKISGGSIKRLGLKVGNNLSVFGRKAVNTVDRVAPIASLIATAAGHPEIGAAITGGQAAIHSGDKAIRAGVAVAGAKKENLNKRLASFGEAVEDTKEKVNPLLRQ